MAIERKNRPALRKYKATSRGGGLLEVAGLELPVGEEIEIVLVGEAIKELESYIEEAEGWLAALSSSS